ncbi:hypothetical protein VST7929_01615 [Vibrio stylophorae]|uniref:Uncharacterized protein n=1 Tax=Vibrio stylophorae TaxID=659351 RepID=A0ABM8ZTU5_9VIBR|nr:hypothetical protein [Vibrio stylophorae]CAH0533740.1 hypothetical protein VST7929_01615 [Vibrio stylophorae]
MLSIHSTAVLAHYQAWSQQSPMLTGFALQIDWASQRIAFSARTLQWELDAQNADIDDPQSWPLQSEWLISDAIVWPEAQGETDEAQQAFQQQQASTFHQCVQLLYRLRQAQHFAEGCLLTVVCYPQKAYSHYWSQGAAQYLNRVGEVTREA